MGNRRNRMGRMGRAGFTLIEVLVTLVLIALLVGVVLPSVINQLDRGEPARLAQDVEAVRSAAKMFRIDVKRWPANLQQLVVSPESSGWTVTYDDYAGNTIQEALWKRWNGPYLEVGSLTASSTLPLALGTEVSRDFGTQSWGGTTFLTATVTDITQDLTQRVSEIIDGNDTVTTTDDGGRIRYDGSSMQVLLAPVN